MLVGDRYCSLLPYFGFAGYICMVVVVVNFRAIYIVRRAGTSACGFVMGVGGAGGTITKLVSVHATHLQSPPPLLSSTFLSGFFVRGRGGEEVLHLNERTNAEERATKDERLSDPSVSSPRPDGCKHI